jgi:hypothetical protein
VIVDDTEYRQLASLVAGARAARLLPLSVNERHLLFSAVPPDCDGVLRACAGDRPAADGEAGRGGRTGVRPLHDGPLLGGRCPGGPPLSGTPAGGACFTARGPVNFPLTATR